MRIYREREERTAISGNYLAAILSMRARRSLSCSGEGVSREENGLFDCKGREWSVAVDRSVRPVE